MSQASLPQSGDSPFITHRRHLDVYSVALASGLSDDDYINHVEILDHQVAQVAGVGFTTTPLQQLETSLDRDIWAKTETANVGGSHKARHLFGLLLESQFLSAAPSVQPPIARTSAPRRADGSQPLAIASCGNAAIGAAIVAKAAGRTLDVFVPTVADPLVVERLHALGANVITCVRDGEDPGDPCIAALDRAIADGSEPFTVQGPTCPTVFDGARTIGLELADQLRAHDVEPADLYLQVGGGAFATAVMDGLIRSGLKPLPRLHPVQPLQAHPYVAAWERLLPLLFAQADLDDPPDDWPALGQLLRSNANAGEFDDLIDQAPGIMQPWPTTPTSVATGILDDLTYDWRPLVRHQLRTAGWPVLAAETDLIEATKVASGQINPPPDATGAAGLAGLLSDTHKNDGSGPAVVVLSGIDREWEAAA